MSFKGKFVVPRGSCGGVVAHELGHCALTTLIVTVPTSGNDRYELTVGPVVDGQRGRLFVRHGEMQPMVAADFEVGHSLKEAFGGEWQRTENADDGTAHFEQRVEGVINMQFLKKFEACWDERMGGVAKLLPSAQHISVLGPSSNSENLEIKWWQLLYGKFGGPSFQRNLHQLNARIVLDLKLGMPLDHSIKMCAKHMLHSKRYSVFDTYEIDRDGLDKLESYLRSLPPLDLPSVTERPLMDLWATLHAPRKSSGNYAGTVISLRDSRRATESGSRSDR